MTDGGTTGSVGARTAPPSGSLWRNRDFMILWTGETVSTLGSSMSFFVYPFVGYSLTGSTSQAALAVSASAAGIVVSRLPAGALVDRWHRGRVLFWSSLAGFLLYGSLAVTMLLGALTLTQLVAVAFLAGVADSFFGPAEQAAVRTVVPPRQLPTAFSQNQARQHVGALVGPPLGGVLYAVARWLPFVFDAVTFAAAALAITRIRSPLPAPPQPDQPEPMRRQIAEGMRFLLSRGFLRALLVFASLANFAFRAIFLILTLKLLQAGVHPVAIGMIDAIAAVAGILGAVAAPAIIKRVPTGILAIGSSAVLVVALVPMAFTNNVVVIGLLIAAMMFGNPAGNAAISSYMVAITPDRLQGRANGALGFGASMLTPLGGVAGGFALSAWGGERALLAAAVVVAASVVPMVLSRETRTLPVPDRWEILEA